MRTGISLILFVFLTSASAVSAEDDVDRGVKVGAGSGIEVERRANGVRIRVGSIRIGINSEEGAKDNERNIGRFLTDRQLIEAPVYSEEGRPLGHVEDFVVDTRNGDIPYFAVGFPDRFKGVKLFAIPVGSMKLDLHEETLLWRVELTREKLAGAPGFPRDKWPNIANRKWAKQIDIYYGVVVKEGDFATDFGTDNKPLEEIVPLERASRLIGISVAGIDNRPLGTVERLIFDRRTDTAGYIVLRLSNEFQPKAGENSLIGVPMTAAKFVAVQDKSHFRLPISAERLEFAPRMDLKDALQSEQHNWATDIDAFFEKELSNAARVDGNSSRLSE